MSSPCSVPPWLRILIREETPAQQAICQQHDDDYGQGGSEQARAIADAKLLLGMLQCGMRWPLAERYWKAVRDHGRSHWANAGPWAWPSSVTPEAP